MYNEINGKLKLDYMKRYAKTARASEAMLKLGLSLMELGQKKEGCTTLGAIKSKYPNANKAILDRAAKRGDRVGLHWRVPSIHGLRNRAVRHVLIDTNYWKSFAHARLAVPMGDPGCLSLFAPDVVAGAHRRLSEHLTAEYRVKTTGRGRELDEWKLRTPGSDNHWLDCLVGCAVAASM